MRYIPKDASREPSSWKAHRLTTSLDPTGLPHYDRNLPSIAKNEMRRTLAIEQQYLCAFCMRRLEYEEKDPPAISPTYDTTQKTKIAHLVSQNPTILPTPAETERRRELGLSYFNLVLACTGKSNEEPTAVPNSLPPPKKPIRVASHSHCDDSQRNKDILTLNLFDQQQMGRIRFIDGRVEINDTLAQWELDVELNLNNRYLKQQRQNILNVVSALAQTVLSLGLSLRDSLEKELRNWQTLENGRAKSYCEVATYALTQLIANQP